MTLERVGLKKIRILDLMKPAEPGCFAHLSAASGLVIRGDRVFVVADDELGLGEFSFDAEVPGRMIRLVQGQLPLDAKLRKKSKPDWESLVELPLASRLGELLVIPSGSTERRKHGVCVRMEGAQRPTVHHVDFTPLYARLQSQFSELNIEGGVFLGDRFFLLQRGNGALGQNALIELDAGAFCAAIQETAQVPAQVFLGAVSVVLPSLGGVPLSFTDLTVDGRGRLIFLAAAESGSSTYLDGECQGSVVGILDRTGQVSEMKIIDSLIKAEGIAVSHGRTFCVTDADDPNAPSELFELEI